MFHLCKKCGFEWRFADCTVRDCIRDNYQHSCPGCESHRPETPPNEWLEGAHGQWKRIDQFEEDIRKIRKEAGLSE